MFKKIKAAILGKDYFDARIISDTNPKKAMSILLTLAEAEDPKAMMDLAVAYHMGYVCGSMNEIPKDFVKAAYWYEKLRNKKVLQAFELLWTLYLDAKDEPRAAKALIEAANVGIQNSMRFLGICYLHGNLTLRENYSTGLSWIRKAAKTGDFYSQTVLANIYREGKFVEQDLIKAYMWCLIASSIEKNESYKEYQEALKNFREPIDSDFYERMKPKEPSAGEAEIAKNELSKILSKDQIIKAQQMAETCVAVNYNGFD